MANIAHHGQAAWQAGPRQAMSFAGVYVNTVILAPGVMSLGSDLRLVAHFCFIPLIRFIHFRVPSGSDLMIHSSFPHVRLLGGLGSEPRVAQIRKYMQYFYTFSSPGAWEVNRHQFRFDHIRTISTFLAPQGLGK